ncbi:putative phage tail assembly chaperone [Hahella ganghwensis]|uniref:putative phage tail assembly chaperone n=1 Tax=Hahella ganghwensis TaxID=286420 RepID=UPI0003615DC6|nr:putative phage tail assembly chaperone [Hahella ganghwensis]
MNSQTHQTIDVTAAGKDFSFQVSREAYNKYINSVTPNNKVAPSHNFLVSTVDTEHKDALLELLKTHPGAEIQLVGAVLEEYTPDLGIVAKKRS